MPSVGTGFSLSSTSALPMSAAVSCLLPFLVWCLLPPACVLAGVVHSVCFACRQLPSFPGPLLPRGRDQYSLHRRWGSSTWGFSTCLLGIVGSFYSTPVDGGANVFTRSSTKVGHPNVWSVGAQ